jgi:hypothetical protein
MTTPPQPPDDFSLIICGNFTPVEMAALSQVAEDVERQRKWAEFTAKLDDIRKDFEGVWDSDL